MGVEFLKYCERELSNKKMNIKKLVFISIFLITFLVKCSPIVTSLSTATNTATVPETTIAPILTPTPVPTIQPTSTSTPIALGPNTYPLDVNPLTGLPVQNPGDLKVPPVLVSISNSPGGDRAQAGLSFSSIVFEMFMGWKTTRLLATFYGNYPPLAFTNDEEKKSAQGLEEPAVGPIRSGLLPFESIRQLYGGSLIVAPEYEGDTAKYSQFVNLFGSDDWDATFAMMKVTQLEEIAQAGKQAIAPPNLSGLYFTPHSPIGGRYAISLWMYYFNTTQIFWRYNAEDGSYHRFQNNEKQTTFNEVVDRLTGKPLSFSNVIVLLADHHSNTSNQLEIDLLNVKRNYARLLRDGQIYNVYWTTKSEDLEQTDVNLHSLRFVDNLGNPVPLKPGLTWIEVVPSNASIWETVNSEKYNQLINGRSKGSGYWAVFFKST